MLQHDPDRAAPAWLTAGDTEDEVLGLLKTGKEAEVFVVERRTLGGDRSAILAHKRYRPTKVSHKGELEALGFSRARSFTNDAMYHEGRKFRRSRERRAVERMTDLGKRILADRWPAQELETLVTAHDAGVTVPYPVEFTGDGLLMQMLGDDGVAAPRLVNARLSAAALARARDQFVDDIGRLTRSRCWRPQCRPRRPVAVQRPVVARPALVHRLPPGGRPGRQPPRLRPAPPRRHHDVQVVHPPGPRQRRRVPLRRPPRHGVLASGGGVGVAWGGRSRARTGGGHGRLSP